jgi:hypothetical protein
MRRAFIGGTALAIALLFSAAPGQAGEGGKWTFDSDAPGTPPSGFSFGRTGNGSPGRWLVRSESDAPSGHNVLAQVDADSTDYRFPIAVANEPAFRDAKISLRCKPVSGRVDEACGLVFRYSDDNNYYVTRANALEDNVNLYYVKDGRRRQIVGWNGKVTKGVWHELGVEVRGDQMKVFFDGKQIIDAHDKTFAEPGKVGVWTKADSVTYFDDLTATASP